MAVGQQAITKPVLTQQIYVAIYINMNIIIYVVCFDSWWRHQMETFSALLAICEGNSPVTGEFP